MASQAVRKPRPSLGKLLGTFIFAAFVALLVGGLFLGVAEVISRLWPPSALYVYGVLLAFSLLAFTFPIFIKSDREILADVYDDDIGLAISTQAGYFIVFVIGSSEFLRYWFVQHGGFTAPDADYVSWIRYGVSWVIDNGLANFGQIYGWDISGIHPTTDTTRALVWGYNFLLEFLAIASIVRTVGIVRTYMNGKRD